MAKKDRGRIIYPTDAGRNQWLLQRMELKRRRKDFLKEMMLEMYGYILKNRAKVKLRKHLQSRAKTMKPHAFYIERDRANNQPNAS